MLHTKRRTLAALPALAAGVGGFVQHRDPGPI
jgi:hypothetical protein